MIMILDTANSIRYILICVAVLGMSVQTEAQNRPYFRDVTETHVPTAPQLHILDEAAADVDGDGDLDLALANENSPNRLYLNDGSGKFTDHTEKLELKVEMHSRQAHVADFTGDKLPDILFFNLTSNAQEWNQDPQIRLLVQNGEGRFWDESAERLPFNTFSAYAGTPMDINRDGAMDIIVGPVIIPGFHPLQYRAYLNGGNGKFRDETEDYIPEKSRGRGWDMTVADFNGDGYDDLFVGGWGTQARLLQADK